jgi:uncharacterized OB-fold protein
VTEPSITLQSFFEHAGEGKLTGIKCGGCGALAIPPRGHAGDAPYAIAAVRLVEGVSVLGRVVDIPFDQLAIGRKVRFRPLRIREQVALGFGPV